MKKILYLGILLSFAFLLTGCDKDKTVVMSNGEKVNTSKLTHLHCTRGGEIDNGEVSLQYDLYSKGEVLNLLQSVERVMSSDSSVLDTYENAYRDIHKHYDGLEYYDAEVIRGDTTVTSKITINYEKIDINQLLQIEGEEDNIIEDGVAKVDKWISLAKQFGASCEEVED